MFFVFLTVTLVDFLLQCFMGVAGFLAIEHEDYLYGHLFPKGGYEHGVSLGIACFSTLCLAMVVPLWLVQLTNIVKNTTTFEQFRHKTPESSPARISRDIHSLISNTSDTLSMIRLPELEDVGAFFSGGSMSRSLSLREKIRIVQKKGCCWLCPKTERVEEKDAGEYVLEEGKS